MVVYRSVLSMCQSDSMTKLHPASRSIGSRPPMTLISRRERMNKIDMKLHFILFILLPTVGGAV